MFQMKSIVVLTALLAGAASFAQEALTREEVRAETARARAAGEMAGVGEAWDGSAFKPAQEPSGVFGRPFSQPQLSREEVMAEFERARRSGELDQLREIYWIGGD